MDVDPPPAGICIEDGPDRLVITRRWRNLFALALTAIVLVLLGFCVALFRATSALPFRHPAQLAPMCFGALALVMGYIVLVRLVNSTRITVDAEWVDVRHGPLPWPRPRRSIRRATLARVLVVPRSMSYDGMQATFFHVQAEDSDGACIGIFEADSGRDQASWVARVLSERLGVEWQLHD